MICRFRDGQLKHPPVLTCKLRWVGHSSIRALSVLRANPDPRDDRSMQGGKALAAACRPLLASIAGAVRYCRVGTTLEAMSQKRLFVRPRDLLVVPARRRRGVGPTPAALVKMLARGVAVADLNRLDDDELSVDFVNGSRDDDEVRERIRDWAELVGFRRLWLPGALVPLDPASRELTNVRSRCAACSATFTDGGHDFWAMVRSNKIFPCMCLVCGGALPQWQPVRVRATTDHSSGSPGRRRTRTPS